MIFDWREASNQGKIEKKGKSEETGKNGLNREVEE